MRSRGGIEAETTAEAAWRRRPRRTLAAVLCAAVAWAAGGAPGARAAAEPSAAVASSSVEEDAPSPRAILARALELANASRREWIRFITYREGRKIREREMERWLSRGENGYKLLGVFGGSGDIRGTAVLVLPPPPAGSSDAGDRVESNQYLIYLPALRFVRRISGAQRADYFFGTHLSQGDVEPHPASHYRIVSTTQGRLRGEPVHRFTLEPRFDAGFDRMVMSVATSDLAVLHVEQFEQGDDEPIRVIDMRRDWLEQHGESWLPRKLVVEDPRARGHTEVVFWDRELDDDIPDSLFSASQLERSGR